MTGTTLDFSELILIDTAVTCDTCNGACCREMDCPPFGHDELEELETRRPDLYAELEAQLDDRMRAPIWYEGNPCSWLDQQTGLCKHYEDRPDICRDFMAGSIACVNTRRAYRLPSPSVA